jgi:hypothetical protein
MLINVTIFQSQFNRLHTCCSSTHSSLWVHIMSCYISASKWWSTSCNGRLQFPVRAEVILAFTNAPRPTLLYTQPPNLLDTGHTFPCRSTHWALSLNTASHQETQEPVCQDTEGFIFIFYTPNCNVAYTGGENVQFSYASKHQNYPKILIAFQKRSNSFIFRIIFIILMYMYVVLVLVGMEVNTEVIVEFKGFWRWCTTLRTVGVCTLSIVWNSKY